MNNVPHDKIIFFDIDHTIFDTQKFWDTKLVEYSVHPEVKAVLQEIKKNALLGIFSEGEKDFQYEKLKKTGILDMFESENIFISLHKMEVMSTILEKYAGKKLYFVDDKLTILHMVSQIDPTVATIWVARGYYAEKQLPIPGFEPTITIPNLESLPQYISPT